MLAACTLLFLEVACLAISACCPDEELDVELDVLEELELGEFSGSAFLSLSVAAAADACPSEL